MVHGATGGSLGTRRIGWARNLLQPVDSPKTPSDEGRLTIGSCEFGQEMQVQGRQRVVACAWWPKRVRANDARLRQTNYFQ